jgi:hypothetical protein
MTESTTNAPIYQVSGEKKLHTYACDPQTPSDMSDGSKSTAEQQQSVLRVFSKGKLVLVQLGAGLSEPLAVPEESQLSQEQLAKMSEADRELARDIGSAIQETDRCIRDYTGGSPAPLIVDLVLMSKKVKSPNDLPFLVIKRRVNSAESKSFEKAVVDKAKAAEPKEAVVEPKEAVVEPKEAVVEPKEAVVEPKEAVAEPKEAVVEPKEAVVEEPKDVVVAPKEAVVAITAAEVSELATRVAETETKVAEIGAKVDELSAKVAQVVAESKKDANSAGWGRPEYQNMREESGAKLFDASFVAAYAAMKPLESGVYVVSFECPFYNESHGMILWLRTVIYITGATEQLLSHVPIEERESVLSSGGGRSLVVLRLVRSMISQPVRQGAAPHSGEEFAAIKETLVRADDYYSARRHAQRRSLIGRQLPVINNLIFRALSKMLVNRKRQAAPYVPQPLLVIVPVERYGTVVDMDGVQCKDISQIEQALAKCSAKVEQLEREIGDALDAKVSKKTPLDVEKFNEQQSQLWRCKIDKTDFENLIDLLKTTNPNTSILMLVIERGLYQDLGEQIRFCYNLSLNYEALERIVDAVKENETSVATTAAATDAAMAEAARAAAADVEHQPTTQELTQQQPAQEPAQEKAQEPAQEQAQEPTQESAKDTADSKEEEESKSEAK